MNYFVILHGAHWRDISPNTFDAHKVPEYRLTSGMTFWIDAVLRLAILAVPLRALLFYGQVRPLHKLLAVARGISWRWPPTGHRHA